VDALKLLFESHATAYKALIRVSFMH